MVGKNSKSVKKVHTDTQLLGYTKIRNTDISVSALIAVSKRRKTHPQERFQGHRRNGAREFQTRDRRRASRNRSVSKK